MGKKKLGPLAAALVAVDALSPEETATMLDYLRAKQPKAARKPAAKKEGTPKRRGENGPVLLPDNPDNFLKDEKVG